MKKYEVKLEATKFGTDNERVELTYVINARDEGHASACAIDMAANEGFYVDEVEILECSAA